MTRKFIETAAEKAGWNVEIEKCLKGWSVSFSTDTTHGQDVCYEYDVKTLDEIPQEVQDTYNGYDPDEEAALWYNQHRGEPDSLRELLNDMEEVEESLRRLSAVLNGEDMPNENKVCFTQKANELRAECLTALVSNSHNAKPSKLGYDAKGFANPDTCSLYEEIIFLDYKWVLLDGNSNIYSIYDMPLDEFCEMVDAIINGKGNEQ